MEKYADGVYNRAPLLSAVLPGSLPALQAPVVTGTVTGASEGAASTASPHSSDPLPAASPTSVDEANGTPLVDVEESLATAYLARDDGDKVGEEED
jgi:hypothetical protein